MKSDFIKCNPRKSPVSDKIGGNVLKHCAVQLAAVFTDIQSILLFWYSSCLYHNTIIPVAKVSRPSGLNNFHPIALTSLVMKCFEQLLRKYIVSETQKLYLSISQQLLTVFLPVY